MSKPVKIGSWGGNGGSARDIPQPATPTRLINMNVRSGDVIDAVSFSYTDQDGYTHNMGPWGGQGGSDNKIEFSPLDRVTKITWTVGKIRGADVVSSLTINTNNRTYGPYGKATGTTFSIPVLDGKIVGFFGRSGDYLDAIGCYVLP